jgi:putative flippase GtrA
MIVGQARPVGSRVAALGARPALRATFPTPTVRLPVVRLPAVPARSRTLCRQLLRFAVVGALGTVVSTVLYVVLRTWWDAVPANLVAIALSTVVSTEANRRFTFDGAAADRSRAYLQNAGTVLACSFSSSTALVVVSRLVDDPTVLQESLAVAGAALLGGLARFVVLRSWVFGEQAAA